MSSMMLGIIDNLGERLMAAAESKPGPLAMRDVLEGRKSYSRGFASWYLCFLVSFESGTYAGRVRGCNDRFTYAIKLPS